MSMYLYWLLLAIFLVSLTLSVIFSFRYRRQQDTQTRGFDRSRMNVAMGVMLIDLALMQMLLFEVNRLRTILAAIFLLVGLFNLFSGLRSHSFYLRHEATRRDSKPPSTMN